MSDLKSSTSAGMFDDWSRLLRDTDRRKFLQACTEAEADDERLQAVLSRYFSTWRTNLMGDDLSRLQMLAACERIRDCVKVVCVEDDFDYIDDDDPEDLEEVIELYERFNYNPILIWPRHEDGQIVTEALGIELLNSVLVAKQLRPDIKDKGNNSRPSDPEAAGFFARNILDGADLALKAFSVNMEWPTTTIIVAELSPEDQGQGMGLSILHSAKLMVRNYARYRLDSYWANQILYHAPALKELKLSFWQPRGMEFWEATLIIDHPSLLKLERLEISGVCLSIQNVMAILGESQQSLKGISLTGIELVGDSTWLELLTRIASEFPHLTWFRIAFIRQWPGNDQFQVVFPGLKNDSVLGEPYRNGLILVEKGPVDNRRMSGVEYGGPHAHHVLKILAEHARRLGQSNNV
jgi:hypothetical protein